MTRRRVRYNYANTGGAGVKRIKIPYSYCIVDCPRKSAPLFEVLHVDNINNMTVLLCRRNYMTRMHYISVSYDILFLFSTLFYQYKTMELIIKSRNIKVVLCFVYNMNTAFSFLLKWSFQMRALSSVVSCWSVNDGWELKRVIEHYKCNEEEKYLWNLRFIFISFVTRRVYS